jgi:hypothetical protein
MRERQERINLYYKNILVNYININIITKNKKIFKKYAAALY